VHADNDGVEHTVRDGVNFFLTGSDTLTFELSLTLGNLEGIAALFNDQPWLVALGGSVTAQQGEEVELDLDQTLQFESIAVYTLDGQLYPGLTLTSESGAVYPFLNAPNGPPPQPSSAATAPALSTGALNALVLVLLGIGALGFRRRQGGGA
jgi:hypothetical protein